MTDTVLLVDDSLTVRMDLTEAFEAAGLHVRACATAAEARAVLARESVVVAVLDVLLPDGDGIDLLRDLRASPTHASTAVLMLSTEAEVSDRVRGLKTGADEYVGKPYDADHVVARARELIRGRQLHNPAAKACVLIIDDSVTFRERLRQALEEAGYLVLTATNGEEGLRIAAAQRPTAIMVDGMLPGIDGPTVIRRVRLDVALRGVPCVLLTASEDRDAELRALDAGADAFVRKEDDVEVILARLTATFRRADRLVSDATTSLLDPKRILTVDDSATYLQELAEVLRSDGYDVVLAHSGEEALDLLGVQSVDCILLDLVMPGLGGQETCRRIKLAPVVRNIPLIMLTAREDRAAMLEGLGAGADDYVPKSSEFDVLKARVRAQIRRKQFEDENRRIREELLCREMEGAKARAARDLAEARAVLLEELERKNRDLEAFSYSVSHDLRAPLRSIDGFSLALQEDCGASLDAKALDHLHRVRAAAQRMGELIDDMLQLSRVGRTELKREPVDLSAMARLVAAGLERGDPSRAVELEIQDGITADADSGLTRILMENLIGNAWKFTSKVEHPRVEFSKSDEPEGCVYAVKDNGAGFDMAYVAKLFRPFQRLHSEESFAGTGIGLATVHRIVERHGGRVWAEGAVGVGAKILFTLAMKSGVGAASATPGA